MISNAKHTSDCVFFMPLAPNLMRMRVASAIRGRSCARVNLRNKFFVCVQESREEKEGAHIQSQEAVPSAKLRGKS